MNKLKGFMLLLILSLIAGISACSSTPKQAEQKPQEQQQPITQEQETTVQEKAAESVPEENKQTIRHEEEKTVSAGTIVYFAPDSYTVDSSTVYRLDAIAADLKSKNISRIKVVGHSSRLNSSKAEEQISLRRALAVARYFQDIGLFSSENIEISAAGAAQPAGPHAEITERQNNRRVEIHY